jgi:hypothetical protein
MHQVLQPYDIIGDIHGQADLLIDLLRQLGYTATAGTWRHPERKAIFLGDFIDLGPKQIETVMIARRMVEGGSALAVMGNHELNAIAWFLPDPANPEDYLRSHNSPEWGGKNRHQHAAFLAAVEGHSDLHSEIIDWFLTLPLWLDLPDLRVVHACWQPNAIEYLSSRIAPGATLTPDLMTSIATGSKHDEQARPALAEAVEVVTKGIEIRLPEGYSFKDKYGIARTQVRARWWDGNASTFREAALLDEDLRQSLPELPIPTQAQVKVPEGKPVFIGHYWLTGSQSPLSSQVVCVDYSAGRGGPLCAYRWDGQSDQLNENSFHCVRPRS